MRNFISLSLLIILLASCYEKQEGCLDFRAKNYDFSADKPCSDCCTYPSMRLGVSHEWGDTTLMSDSIYYNLANQPIRILNAQFYLHQVSLTDNGQKVSVVEKLSVTDLAGFVSEISAANAFVQSARFNYTLGSFEEAQTYDGLDFKLGIDGQYTNESLVENESFFDVETFEYVNFRMEYISDIIAQDTLQFELKGLDFVANINLDATLEIPLGVDFTLKILADYQLLFNDIDIINIETPTQKANVLANFQRFFRFK